MSGSVQVFGRRDDETDPTLKRPATKKRQGTKSRESSALSGNNHYGDCTSPPLSMVGATAVRDGMHACMHGSPAAGRKAATRIAERFHNFRVPA